MKYRLAFISVLLSTWNIPQAADYTLASPNGLITATISHNTGTGALTYRVTHQGSTLLDNSPLGLATNNGDFATGLLFNTETRASINETYTLPQGKVSTYLNRANELTLSFSKGQHNLSVIFRAYDQGIAFRYAIPGSGSISITSEASGFKLTGAPVFWGQGHPNNYGNEMALGKVAGPDFSLSLLCELATPKYWILLGQAATYASYCIPYLQNQSGVLKFKFPIQQTGPIATTLPFASPWRVAVISPGDLSAVVEQTLFENLNPPTEAALAGASWIKPGRATWDWFAGDKGNLKGWTDATSSLGWEYHMVDDGWEGYIGNIGQVVSYATSKNVGIMAWKSTPSVAKPADMHAFLKKWQDNGFKGAKIDFFDRLPDGTSREDYEDTQMGLIIRDSLITIAAQYKQQVIFHGASLPSGERRRWPHVLGIEAILGQEGDPAPFHDNCIAYIRNPVGSVDYSPVWFGKNGKSDAYQLATSVVFESGFLIFADLHSDYLAHPSKPFLSALPSTWDDVKFLSGYPGSHTVIARRKGEDWYVGCMSTEAGTRTASLGFLKPGIKYRAEIYRDNTSGTALRTETREVFRTDSLSFPVLAKGGYAVRLERLTPLGVRAAAGRLPDREITFLGLQCVFPAEWSGARKSIAVYDLAGKQVYSVITKADRFDAGGIPGAGKGLRLFKIRLEP